MLTSQITLTKDEDDDEVVFAAVITDSPHTVKDFLIVSLSSLSQAAINQIKSNCGPAVHCNDVPL